MSIGEKLRLRLEEVTAERDEAREITRKALLEFAEVKDERDALAATVNYMKALADEAYGSYASCHDAECAAALTKMISVQPTTSLKAEWQAEALQAVLDDSDDMSVWATLRNRINELRRQLDPTP